MNRDAPPVHSAAFSLNVTRLLKSVYQRGHRCSGESELRSEFARRQRCIAQESQGGEIGRIESQGGCNGCMKENLSGGELLNQRNVSAQSRR